MEIGDTSRDPFRWQRGPGNRAVFPVRALSRCLGKRISLETGSSGTLRPDISGYPVWQVDDHLRRIINERHQVRLGRVEVQRTQLATSGIHVMAVRLGNVDERTVHSFGEEWSTYDQSRLADDERMVQRFEEYFAIFPWHALPQGAAGADIGCGSGRWALYVAPRIGLLHCVDASDRALAVARRNLASRTNCLFHHASVDAIPLPPGSLDFCYSLGVLHHVPDTLAGIKACTALLKPGAPLLLYLYYALDTRPWWYRAIWKAADILRRGISSLPVGLKRVLTEIIAATVYWPIARLGALIEMLGGDPSSMPLSWYRDKPFYTMRTNAYDRFATPLEQRFSRAQIEAMMREAGLEDIRFSERPPFWCAVGRRIRGDTP